MSCENEIEVVEVALIGTDKQVEWAESIRDKFHNCIYNSGIDGDSKEACIAQLWRISSASWFIERRGFTVEGLVADLEFLSSLPELRGTEKQVAWAATLREKMLKAFDDVAVKYCNESDNMQAVQNRSLCKKIFKQLQSVQYAHWWIDHRDLDWLDVIENGLPEVDQDQKKKSKRSEYEPDEE
ncbi:MAG: hypothetical protein LBP59_10520 [Planctomycetaceae bacterium]|jgi:hypothetical protein|nr:hypothetical protein [Planctomycetaceae bacterium]